MAFPVTVQNQVSVTPNDGYYGGQGTNAYGLFITIAQTQIASAASGGANFGNVYAVCGYGPQPGRAAVVRGFKISCSNKATFQIRMGYGTGPLKNINIPEMDLAVVVGPAGEGKAEESYISCNWVIRNGQSFVAYITRIFDSTQATVCISPDVYTITDDFNYNALNYMAWIGTSITNGTGPTSTAYMYHTLFASRLRFLGKSVKNEFFGISGSTSLVHYTKFTKGEYDIMPNKKPPAIVFIELAVNDASSGGTALNYTTRLQIYAERFLNHPEDPNILVVILGGTPLENTTAWNNLLVLDAAALALVNTLKATYPGRVFYIECHNSFTRTDTTKYSSLDTAGSRIHENDSGHADVYNNSFLPFLATDDGIEFLNAIQI